MNGMDLSGTWNLRVSDGMSGGASAAAAAGEAEPFAAFRDAVFPCAIPGEGHSALIAARAIPDPYAGRGELDVQFLNRADWTFEREFELSSDLAAMRHSVLRFESVDTVAEIAVNGTVVARSSNMFRAIRILVTGLLRAGSNVVRVVCRSAELEAVRRAAELSYPVPFTSYPVQSPHRNLLRKVQCHAGWDWGPCLMTAGIAGAVRIDFTDSVTVERLSARVLKEGELWKVPIELEYSAVTQPHAATAAAGTELPAAAAGTELPVAATAAAAGTELRLRVRLEGPVGPAAAPRAATAAEAAAGTVAAPPATIAMAEAALSPQEGTNLCRLELTVRDPELWWPAGYGEQPLYRLVADVEEAAPGEAALGEAAPGEAAVVIASASKRIGFRELRTVAEEDERGRSLFFRVNGRAVWAKGANWIPVDALDGRTTAARYRELLGAAAAANMNMIRLWGGGRYEADVFYDICDELGLLVWHDMMFSCSLYPSTPSFLQDVREEIRHQVLRLKEHACIALWCGNNENVGALNWFEESRKFRDRYVIDYDRLNEGVVGKTVREFDPDRAWWPSSPSAGPDDFSDCWHADGRGDMHFWSVWHEGKPFEAYFSVAPRFCSEFGYQSFPSEEGVASYCPEDQRNLTSPVMEHHQKNLRGNSIILENFSRYFRFPEGFANTLYMSQVQQAIAIKTAVAYWRSLRPVCMGALYWQLNDCWPVASWSSLEYSGKWKLLHYAARRFFAPLAAFAWRKDGRISVFIVNDGDRSVAGMLELRLLRFDGSATAAAAAAAGAAAAAAWSKSFRVTAAAEASTEVWSMAEAGLLSEAGTRPDEVFLHVAFRPDRKSAPGGSESLFDYESLKDSLFLTEPKRCELADARVQASVEEGNEGLSVKLSCTAPAFCVALDAPGLKGRWEDNLMTLLPGETRTVAFLPAPEAARPTAPQATAAHPTAAALRAALTVRYLRSTYT